ncbi:hypothetical protein [Paraburkholderia rhizosphaerae]|uniref:Lipoprotein n=1 Tax=Paraburkholderia rhizosphaerae TaxID=480658 RepID=A0A4R8L7E8_9BURK|nr:hypothetical protein [Paraburkholderia rhizosphaerae]TDY37820.1 hypothetical protein BX592_13416 [Paraburkholderia rhizosphaerae]
MKFIRTLFLLLLCAMLPITGLAATGLTGECPMQRSVATQDDSSMSDAMPGCDSMKPSPHSKSSKAGFCKMTAQCQFGSLYYPSASETVVRPAAPDNRMVFHYSQSLSIRAPDGLWRPPRSL